MTGSTALCTDHYELTMLAAALADGTAARHCCFEVQARRLPPGRRYGVAAGQGRLADALAGFRFGPAELEWLAAVGVVDAATLRHLEGFRFRGDIDAMAEGEVYLPGEPVAVVSGTFAECVVLETVVLSVLNHDSAVAAAASRMVTAAQGRPLVEMGARRTHEGAAVAAARSAYVAGFAATSDLEAGRRWGLPTTGTSGHAFTLLHDTERDAFVAQVATQGVGTTLLVDTYDVAAAVATAVQVAGPGLGAVRLDSGDLGEMARAVRAQLDRLGAHATRIVVTSDLDEYSIAALANAPVDSYGVGTSLVTGSGQPTAGFVYKMVERDGVAVSKSSPGKAGRGGRRCVSRRREGATAVADVQYRGTQPPTRVRERALLTALLRGGEPVDDGGLAAARRHHAMALAELPLAARSLSYGDPALPLLEPDPVG
jgi:nicotinate phosphoribosyltransferase